MRTSYLGLLAATLAAMPATILAAPHPSAPAFTPGLSLHSYTSSTGSVAPLHVQETHPTIKGSYMVMLKNGLSATQFLAHQELISMAQQSASAFHGSWADGIGHIYDLDQHLQGYAGKFTDDVVDYIRSLPEVDYVELDSVVKTTDMPSDGSMIRDIPYDVSIDEAVYARAEHPVSVEKGAPWVSQQLRYHSLPQSMENLNPDRMRWPLVLPPMFLLLTQGLARVSHRKELGLGSFSKYLYDDHAGEGVVAYIIE